MATYEFDKNCELNIVLVRNRSNVQCWNKSIVETFLTDWFDLESSDRNS